jgi:hypothetical protein
MRLATGAELAAVMALGLTLIVQANGAGAPPVAAPAPAAPTADEVVAAVALAERKAEEVNGPRR